MAKTTKATYLRVDSFEQGLKDIYKLDQVEGEGYRLSYIIAKDNLLSGNSVIADSVNPWELSRKEWNNVASSTGTRYINIEVVCSDQTEHKKRVETRTVNIPNLKPPTWQEVTNRDYHKWNMPRIVIDTANKSIENCLNELTLAINNNAN